MFDPPVHVRSEPDGPLHIANESPDAVAAAFLLRATDDGGTIVALGPLPAHGTLDVPPPAATASRADYLAEARERLAAALRATGLCADEAQAMVDTWTRSWFGNAGLRVLYIAPPSWADALLPMDVTPAPSAVVRAFVGRIEVLLPAEEQALVAALDTGDPLAAESLGRFAEPRLRRALTQLRDPEAQSACEALVEEAHDQP